MADVGGAAPDPILREGAEEREARLSEYWREAPVVALFLRHFGWPYCRRHLVQVQRDLEEFEKRNAKLVAIGMGTGAEAAAMAERLELGFPLLGDPGHEAYQAFGLVRDGWYGLLVRPFLAHPLRAARDVADADLKASTSPRSDVQRLGGVAIVDRGGALRYLHRAERSDDQPPNAELLAALDRL